MRWLATLAIAVATLAGCSAENAAQAGALNDDRCKAPSVRQGMPFTTKDFHDAHLPGAAADGKVPPCARWDKTACLNSQDLAHVDYYGGRHYWARVGSVWHESVSGAADDPLYQSALHECDPAFAP